KNYCLAAVLKDTRRRLPKWQEPQCPLWVDTVEKVVSDPPKRNNRIRTARYLNRNCVRGRDFESMLRIQGRKIVFQQYRSNADSCTEANIREGLSRGQFRVLVCRVPF